MPSRAVPGDRLQAAAEGGGDASLSPPPRGVWKETRLWAGAPPYARDKARRRDGREASL